MLVTSDSVEEGFERVRWSEGVRRVSCVHLRENHPRQKGQPVQRPPGSTKSSTEARAPAAEGQGGRW